MDGLDSQVNWNKLREFLLRQVKICVRLITTCFISNLMISRRCQDESVKERKRRSLHALHACVGHPRFPGNSIILLEHCCKNNYLRVTQKRAPVLNTPTSRRAWGPLIVVLKHVPTFPQRENRFVYHVTNGAVGEVGTEILKCHPRNGMKKRQMGKLYEKEA